MENLDTPFVNVDDIETPVQIDTPVPEMPAIANKSAKLEDFKAIQAAFIDSYTTGKPVAQGYYEHRQVEDKDTLLKQLATGKAQQDYSNKAQALEEIALEKPDMLEESIDVVSEDKDKIFTAEPNTVEAFVDAVADPAVDEDTRKATENYIRLYQMLEESMSQYDKVDYVTDFAKGIVPFVATAREYNTLGGVIDNEEVMINMIYNFKSKSYEEQQRNFPALAQHFLENLGPIAGRDALTKFIDPNTEGELSDFANAWKLLDVVDAAGIVGSAIRLRKAFNLPKVLNSVNNKEMAGEAVATALVNDEAAQAMNLRQTSAFGQAAPFDLSLTDPAYTKGISTEAQAAMNNLNPYFNKVDKVTDKIISGEGFLKEGVVNTFDRAIKEQQALDNLSTAKHEEITIAGRTENTTTFSYKVKSEDGNVSNESFTLDLTLNDVGQWDQRSVTPGSKYIASPTVIMKGLTRLAADAAQRLDHQTAKLYRQLSVLQAEATKPLTNRLGLVNKKKLEVVDKALLDGDEYLTDTGSRGKLFTPDELQGQYNMDKAQMETYYRTNRLYNNLWRIRNNVKREEAIAFGLKEVKLLDVERSIGKPFETANEANLSLSNRGGKVKQVFDASSDEVIGSLDKDSIDAHYALGKVLVELDVPYSAGAGRGKYSFVLVDKSSVTELPAIVIDRKVGYVPRINEDAFYFVKEFGDETVNGVTSSDQVIKTHRFFDNRKDAETYAQLLKQQDIAKGMTPAQVQNKYRALSDREQEIISTALGKFSHGSGGLYTGARAEDGVLFGLEGTRGKRLNPYQALTRNIANISRLVPINQWRLGLEQEWINTARQLTGQPIDKFGSLPKTIEGTQEGEFLNVMADQIRDWQGFPTESELFYKSATQQMYEWALKKELGTTSKIFGWIRDRDPIIAGRAAAFHALLGWFNPAQLWVQAQGMSIAVSLSMGKDLTKVLRQTSGLTILGHWADAPSKGRLSIAAKAAGMDAKELEDLYKLWDKTGLHDSILQTADHAAAMRGHGIGMEAVKKVADAGLMFYRPGELLSRRTAFTHSVNDFLEKNPKKTISTINDADLKLILDRTNNTLLNLTKANRAAFQKGVFSIPTQFLQVSTKALETVAGFNNNFSRAERGRILLGQLALYGTAGVPLASLGVGYAKEVLGFTQEDLDNNPLLVKTINDGFWGFTTLGIFGVDAEVSSRGSLIRGMTDFVDNWMFTESHIVEKLGGAMGQTGYRFWDEFMKELKPLTIGSAKLDAANVTRIVTLPFLNTVSTWRNAEKALFMEHMKEILDRRGNVVVEKDFNLMEKLSAAIGFRLTDEVKIWDMNELNEALSSSNAKYADLFIHRMNEAAFRKQTGTSTPEYEEETELFYATLFQDLPMDRQSDIMASINTRLKKDSKEVESIKKYKEKVIGNQADLLMSIHNALTGTKLLTVDEPKEEK